VRKEAATLQKAYEKTEDDLKTLQHCGQHIGEVLSRIVRNGEVQFIIKLSKGPRYVVNFRPNINLNSLKVGTRVAIDMTTLTLMRPLPPEVDPAIFHMIERHEHVGIGGKILYSDIGGLSEQIRELREVIELPLTNPELFVRVGIKPPKGVLLYGPPGTGKTLLARALANNIEATYMKVVASAIVDKYIGESSRTIRQMFGYAKDHQPCVIFMDEVDAIGGRRLSHGTSADREIQRTLMELLNQLDGFEALGRVKIVMATNRPDTLDPALLRPGRLDRKIEIPLPNESSRLDILKIHAAGLSKQGDIDYDAIIKLTDGFNGADLRNLCTEAGNFSTHMHRDVSNDRDDCPPFVQVYLQSELNEVMFWRKTLCKQHENCKNAKNLKEHCTMTKSNYRFSSRVRIEFSLQSSCLP
jgi:26S proteasome regulatory subunit T4